MINVDEIRQHNTIGVTYSEVGRRRNECIQWKEDLEIFHREVDLNVYPGLLRPPVHIIKRNWNTSDNNTIL